MTSLGWRTKVVIFDCDGVLVDSEPHLQGVDLRLIAELGWPITAEEICSQHLGRSTAEVIANIERHIGGPVPGDFAARRKSLYRTSTDAGLRPIPGVENAIAEIVAAGYGVCVASSGSPEAIEDSLTRTGLAGLFGAQRFSSHQVPAGKPAPDIFLFACHSMRARPADCVVVEDSPAGVAAARAAHIPVVGFARAGTLKYEHLFRAPIDDGGALAMETARFRDIYNRIRPHQSIGNRTPPTAYLRSS